MSVPVMALINADLQLPILFNETLTDEQLATTATTAARTFLHAYGRQYAPADKIEEKLPV
ncbi:hypothetical protein L598_000100000530 [Mesorhizobium sp. J18]|uniref:hypothetical protein n=1 Tax=Mesorhizobium sp. J18 TaxID=935263 RepID=UPI00119C1901|nr:hypothetical protein [Mesorhizobium sp. J18]TWH01072.1 hypothetical protein L598_000100000530 [Mesorhizobium sp. J18]